MYILTSCNQLATLCVQGQWLSTTYLPYNRDLVNPYCINEWMAGGTHCTNALKE